MIMTAGASAATPFFNVVSGGPGNGVVSVVSSSFVDQDPTSIHAFIDNYQPAGLRVLTDVRIELNDFTWNGNALASDAAFGLSFSNANPRLIIKDNFLNLGRYLAPYSDINTAATNGAVFAIAASADYTEWDIRNQTLISGCL